MTKALKEIESLLKGVDLIQIVLKALVILSLGYLFLFMLGIKGYYAFVPAMVYFISSLFVEVRIDPVKKVERKYPELNEKLRTARDYQHDDSAVLNALETDIVKNLKDVKLSSFFSITAVFLLTFLLLLAVTSSLYIASQNIRLIDFDRFVDDAMKRFDREDEQNPEEITFEQSEESIMEVGNEKIEVEINPVGMDFDFNDVSESEDYEFTTSFPKDIFISSGASYEQEFTEEQQELIKRYFERKNG